MGFGVNKRGNFFYRNISVILFIILELLIISIDTVSRYFALLELKDLQQSSLYYVFRVVIFTFIFSSFLFDRISVGRNFNILHVFYLYFFVCLFSIFISALDIVDLFKASIYTFSFIFIFRFGILYGATNNKISPVVISILCTVIVIMLQFSNTYILKRNSVAIISNDAIFSLIVFVPFLFLLNNKKLMIAILLLMLIFAVFSQKRSAVISLSLSLIIAFFIYFINVSKAKMIIGTFLFLFLGFFIYKPLENSDYIIAITNRFNNGGSNGRNEILDNSLDQFYNSNILINYLFGFGYSATTKNNGIPIHNDFLEILYDFGILAFLIYCVIIILLGVKCVTWFKHRLKFMKYYLSYVVAYAMLVLLSFFNALVFSIYPTVLFLSLGLSYGYITIKLKNKI